MRISSATRLGIAFGTASFALTLVAGHLGVTWDEPFIAQGGRFIVGGLIPYRDFGIPMGPALFYLQALGELLLPGSLLAYCFAACVLNGAIVGSISWLVSEHLKWGWWSVLAMAIVVHCAFFGGAGCLWYNQFSVYGVTLAFAFIWLPRRHRRLSAKGLVLLAAVAAVAVTTKPDFGGIGIVVLIASILALNDNVSDGLYQVFGFLVMTAVCAFVLFLPFVMVGGTPGEWINIGQPGYDKRIPALSFFLSRQALGTFLRSQFRVLWALVALTFVLALKSQRQRNWYPIGIVLLLTVGSMITTVTSGQGGGFLILHWLPLALLVAGRQCEGLGVPLVGQRLYGLILFVTALAGIKSIYHRDARLTSTVSLSRVASGPMKGLVSSPETAQFFENFDQAVSRWQTEQGRPLTVYSSGFYFLKHPLLHEKLYQGALWPHAGITIANQKLGPALQSILEDPPDVFFTFGYLDDPLGITRLDWSNEAPRLERLLAQQYRMRLRGVLSIVGTAGGAEKVSVGVSVRSQITPISSASPHL